MIPLPRTLRGRRDMDDHQQELAIKLMEAELQRMKERVDALESDRRSFLKSGLIAVGSAAIGLLIYIWQARFP